MGGAEDVRPPFEVVGHQRKTQLGAITRLPAQQKTWVTGDPVLDRCEGVVHDESSQCMTAAAARSFIRVSASSNMRRETRSVVDVLS